MGLKEAATERMEGHGMVNGFREPPPIAFKSTLALRGVTLLQFPATDRRSLALGAINLAEGFGAVKFSTLLALSLS